MAINLETVSNLGLRTVENSNDVKKQELGQDQFLTLLTTQLTHQDPTKPMENGDFLAQMAQFSTVEGIRGLQDSFTSFASSLTSNQSLQAASLVGSHVVYPSNQAVLDVEQGLSGSVHLNENSSEVRVNISRENGELLKTLTLDASETGLLEFHWDGVKEDGSIAEPGRYQISAEAEQDGVNTALKTYTNAEIESVDLAYEDKGVVLNLGQLGSVEFNDVVKVF